MKRPILWLAISFCLGIIIARLAAGPFGLWAGICVLSLLFAFLCRKFKLTSHIFIYLAVILIGGLLYQNSKTLPVNHIANFTLEEKRRVLLSGVIVDDPITTRTFYRKEKVGFVLEAHRLKEQAMWTKVTGLVKVNLYEPRERILFGDEVILEGELSRPECLRNPGTFDYRRYLENRNIYSILKVKKSHIAKKVGQKHSISIQRTAYSIRSKLKTIVDRHLDQPHSSLLKAILIRDRSTLPHRIREDFMKTGTVHVLPTKSRKKHYSTLPAAITC